MTMHRTHLPILLALAAAASALFVGCARPDTALDKPFNVAGPLVSGDRLVWLNRSTEKLIVVDPTGAADVVSLGVMELPRAFGATPNAVFIAGGRGDAASIQIVNVATLDVTKVDVKTAWDRLATAPDGRHAVFFLDPLAAPPPGGPAARNSNEIGVLDVAAGKLTTTVLKAEAIGPQEIVFAPVGDVVAVVLETSVALLRLSDPQVQVVVPLKLPGGKTLRPKQTLFSADGLFLYVRTDDANDVLALEIDTTARLSASVNFLFQPGGGTLSHIVVPNGEAYPTSVGAVFRRPDGGTLALLDRTGDASKSRSAELTHPVQQMREIGEGRFLGFSLEGSGLETARVAAWDPAVDRVDEDRLAAPIAKGPVFGGGVAWFAHGAVTALGGASAVLSRVKVEDDGARLRVRTSPVVLGGPVQALSIDVTGRVLAGVQVARADSGAGAILEDNEVFSGFVSSLIVADPVTLAFSGFAFDAEVKAFDVVAAHVCAHHPGVLGDVSCVPLATPDRASTKRTLGFFLAGVLDRREEVTP